MYGKGKEWPDTAAGSQAPLYTWCREAPQGGPSDAGAAEQQRQLRRVLGGEEEEAQEAPGACLPRRKGWKSAEQGWRGRTEGQGRLEPEVVEDTGSRRQWPTTNGTEGPRCRRRTGEGAGLRFGGLERGREVGDRVGSEPSLESDREKEGGGTGTWAGAPLSPSPVSSCCSVWETLCAPALGSFPRETPCTQHRMLDQPDGRQDDASVGFQKPGFPIRIPERTESFQFTLFSEVVSPKTDTHFLQRTKHQESLTPVPTVPAYGIPRPRGDQLLGHGPVGSEHVGCEVPKTRF